MKFETTFESTVPSWWSSGRMSCSMISFVFGDSNPYLEFADLVLLRKASLILAISDYRFSYLSSICYLACFYYF